MLLLYPSYLDCQVKLLFCFIGLFPHLASPLAWGYEWVRVSVGMSLGDLLKTSSCPFLYCLTSLQIKLAYSTGYQERVHITFLLILSLTFTRECDTPSEMDQKPLLWNLHLGIYTAKTSVYLSRKHARRKSTWNLKNIFSVPSGILSLSIIWSCLIDFLIIPWSWRSKIFPGLNIDFDRIIVI